MKYQSRADLLIAAGESIKMQEAAGIEPIGRNSVNKVVHTLYSRKFEDPPCNYEFPLAVVEGKPVFVGDELWNVPNGFKFTVARKTCVNDELCLWNDAVHGSIGGWLSDMSWNPPKPKTVMVELMREEAEYFRRHLAPLCKHNHAYVNLGKALETK